MPSRGHLHGHDNFHILGLVPEVHPHGRPQDVLSPIFQSCSFQIPDQLDNPTVIAHEAAWLQASGCLSPNKVNNQMFCLLEGFFSISNIFRATSEWGCSAIVIHFWLVPAYHVNPLGKRVQDFSFSDNGSLGMEAMRPQV